MTCVYTSESDMEMSDDSARGGDMEVGENLLGPPTLAATGRGVRGVDTDNLRRQNKRRRNMKLLHQDKYSQWRMHQGSIFIGEQEWEERERVGGRGKLMYPRGRAVAHLAGGLLKEWAEYGCPTVTGENWTRDQMVAAIARGPHKSAMEPAALLHFKAEVEEKVRLGQARVVEWETIKDNPPPQLKISPVAAIPHNSKPYRSILDLSFRLRLVEGGHIPSVNDTTLKTAPMGAIDQIGHALKRLIYAFAETGVGEKVFMAKWDIKDGFWRMDCQEGEEWNFAYVFPQPGGEPTRLVVPTSLQMGWIESPPYFCAASETARDVATEYCEVPVGTLPAHKFVAATRGGAGGQFKESEHVGPLKYLIEVYVDDFISFVIPTSQRHLDHVANAVMHGIHLTQTNPASRTC